METRAEGRPALVVFAKAPEAGEVKTRLRGALTDEERVKFYQGLLEGALLRLGRIEGVDTYVAYSPPEGGAYFARFGLPSFAQCGADLGERMHRALGEVLGRGHGRAVLVGVDIPDLTDEVVREALAALDGHDLVFGPAEDGGYYLVGLKTPVREVFEDMPWSSPLTLGESLMRAARLGLAVGLVRTLRDIDTAEDLRRVLHAR